MATRVTDADGGALFLYKPNGQVSLEKLHCQDIHQRKHIRKALEAATSVVTASLTTAQLLPAGATLDAQVSRSLGSSIQLFGTTILVKQTERGRLYVFSSDPEYTWTETRQKLVRLVADQTAVAIENDELKVELRKKERLDRELEIGAEIQLRLLPRQCPNVPGVSLAARCQPANRVGGDYYDFIPVDRSLSQTNSTANAASPWGLVLGT
jgi:sigma-B regulation protein RsbU (phosphoserine phosphatase)